ncbi:MAG: hypothetical protein MZU95_15160 [Desulfomicrobium escambiense]|nr:hypothetical protein [Desulfomicrobium escambiense]
MERRRLVETTVGPACIFSEIVPHGDPFEFINRRHDQEGHWASWWTSAYSQARRPRRTVAAGRPPQGPGLPVRHPGRHLHRHRGHDDPQAKEETHRQGPGRRVRDHRTSTTRASSPTANGTTRSSTSGRKVTDQIAVDMMRDLKSDTIEPRTVHHRSPGFNPIFMMADSGARGIGAADPPAGRHARPDGQALRRDHRDTHHVQLPRGPRPCCEYFISTHGARKGLADTALKTANSGYLTRRLVDVAQDVIITEEDCGTARRHRDGGPRSRAARSSRPWASASSAAWRWTTSSTRYTGEVLVQANDDDRRGAWSTIDRGRRHREGHDPLGADLPSRKRGVCAKCYGRDLATGRLVNIGEAVGVIAAQSIGEPGTQLTMRTFHIGGTASRSCEQSQHRGQARRAPSRFNDLNVVTPARGRPRRHEPQRRDRPSWTSERPRARDAIPSSTARSSRSATASRSRPATMLAEWDPYTMPILTEVAGTVKFRRHRRGHHRAGAGRRGHRPVAPGHHRVARTRSCSRASTSSTRPARSPRCRHRTSPLHPAGRRPHHASTKATTMSRRRRAREDPARDHQDQGHHGRPAARRRAVRGAQAQGRGRGHARSTACVDFGERSPRASAR